MIQTVVKRDGRVVGFNEEKIIAAIRRAMLHTAQGEDMELASTIADRIAYRGAEQMTVEKIQDNVEIELMKSRTIQAGRQRKILICADKDRTAKEQHQIHRQNGRGGLDGAAIDSASEKLGTIALAEGRSGIGNQDRQRRCFHAACCRTWRTADQHQKDYYAL